MNKNISKIVSMISSQSGKVNNVLNTLESKLINSIAHDELKPIKLIHTLEELSKLHNKRLSKMKSYK
jgi:hypothetical protein